MATYPRAAVSDDVEPSFSIDLSVVPEPDRTAEPDGFVVEVDGGTRIHFLDWGGPAGASVPRVLLLHGLAQTAWAWTPVARRLRRVARVVAADLRGHGLSDSPTEGYDSGTLAADLTAVAEGSGLIDEDPSSPPLVLAGHGFGAIVASWAAAALGERVAGLLLVDGGWEDLARNAGVEPEEFLRALDEPPEVLRTMEAFLTDRRDFDPSTWDADQEQAARATVVEAHSKRLTLATRPHAVTGSVEAMFGYNPLVVLPLVAVPIVALQAADDEDGTHGRALAEVQQALAGAGRPPIRVLCFPDAGHNLMRYHPRDVAAAILALAGTLRP
jgi:pimeloyl-ACP methyl ester carboxylesterase